MAAGLRLPPHQRPKRKSVSFLPRLFCLQGALFLLYTFSETLLWARFMEQREAPGSRSGNTGPAAFSCGLADSLGRSLSGYTTRLVSGSQDSRLITNHSRGPPFGGQTCTLLLHRFIRSFPQHPFWHTAVPGIPGPRRAPTSTSPTRLCS